MKRLILRVSALAVVLGLGLFALAQAQRDDAEPDLLAAGPTNQSEFRAENHNSPENPNTLSDDLGRPVWNDQRPVTATAAEVQLASHDAAPALPLATPADAAPPSPTPDPFGLQPVSTTSPPEPPGAPVDLYSGQEPGTLELSGPGRPLAPPPAPNFPSQNNLPPQNQSFQTPEPPAPPKTAAISSELEGLSALTSQGNMAGRGPAPLGNDPLPAVPPPALNRSMSPPTAMPELAPPASVPPFGNLATPVAEANGTGQPASDRRLDGLQTSRLTIQKSAPKEIQVGKPAIFRTTVRNVGHVTALGVQIRDRVPKGTRLIKTLPEASPGTQGDLVWSLDDMQPESETTVEMHVMPMAEGEIGSVATLSFQTDASVRTFATRPELSVEVACPREVLIDEEVEMVITISNTGTGVATGVVLEERVPTGLQHPAGAELEYTVGKLGPKQSQTLKLKLSAVRAGAMENVLIARGDGLPTVKKQMPMAVVAPTLKVAMDGPQSRYLERQATYRLSVSNPGSAPAKNVRLEAQLPRGLKFVEADKNGHYDPQSRTIRWALAELPVNETGTVELTALPVEIGTQKLTFRSVAEKALAVEQERQIKVDGLAAIRFQVVDVDDPIEVGGKTTYEIRVLNQGSKDATGVQVVVELPAGLSPVAAEGPDSIRHAIQGNQVVFAPLARLSPKVDTTYRIRVEGRQTGDHRVRVHLQTAEMDKPVVKEESTRVFSDK